MKRLGIDYGAARIGVALHDDTLPAATPRPLVTVSARRRDAALARLVALARENDVGQIVVGIPLAPDGGMGARALQVRGFARELERQSGLPTVLQDERDSSHEALERLIAAGVPMKKRAERIDEMAAAVILERFLVSRPK